MPSDASRRCSAVTKAGEPCRAWAVRGSELCAAHSRSVGAPVGNQNRVTHGFYSVIKLSGIDDVVDDLMQKQEQLSAYIAEHAADLESDDLVKLLALSAQNASRLGRLLRDKRMLSGDTTDGLIRAINRVLDEINTAGVLKVAV